MDYETVSINLTFNTRDVTQCYNVTIFQDSTCEIYPNENFIVNLQYESGIQIITVRPDTANILIDDTNDCGEFFYVLSSLSIVCEGELYPIV